MAILEGVAQNGYLWPHDSLVPLDQIQIGETVFIDFDLDGQVASLPFTLTEVVQSSTDPSSYSALGIVFEKDTKGQFEHKVTIHYNRYPIIRLCTSRLICP